MISSGKLTKDNRDEKNKRRIITKLHRAI
jgi:hypothetical protein